MGTRRSRSLQDTSCQRVLHTCEMIFSDKGVISLIASFFIMVIGVALLVLARQLRLPPG